MTLQDFFEVTAWTFPSPYFEVLEDSESLSSLWTGRGTEISNCPFSSRFVCWITAQKENHFTVAVSEKKKR